MTSPAEFWTEQVKSPPCSRLTAEMETVLLKLSRLLMRVLGAEPRSARLECHQEKVSGRSPSAASQVTRVLLARPRSDLNWKGTILGGRTPAPPDSWRTQSRTSR